MKFQRLLLLALAVALVVPSITTGSDHANAANSGGSLHAVNNSSAPTPVLTRGGAYNQLVANPGKWPSGYGLKYSWRVGREVLFGESKKYYLRQVEDCGKPISVTVTGTKKGSKTIVKTSKNFLESTCEFRTLAYPAWDILADCGAKGTNYCMPFTQNGKVRFLGVTKKNVSSTSWFKIPVSEVESWRVVSWRAVLTGYQQSYALVLSAIGSSAQGVEQGSRSYLTSNLMGSTEEFRAQPEDGNLYVGLSYFDQFGVGETLILDSIQLFVEFEANNG